MDFQIHFFVEKGVVNTSKTEAYIEVNESNRSKDANEILKNLDNGVEEFYELEEKTPREVTAIFINKMKNCKYPEIQEAGNSLESRLNDCDTTIENLQKRQ